MAITLLGFSLIHIFLANFHLYCLIPNLIKQRKYIWYIFLLPVTILLASLLKYGFAESVIFFMDLPLLGPNHNKAPLGIAFFSSIFVVVVTLPFLLFDYLIQKERLEADLKAQKLESQLRFLRAQINPHFLFNALNNIYSMVFLQSEQAAPTILQLSEMMRYMLYESNETTVRLEKEVAFVQNFIRLQTLKQGSLPTVQFDCPEINSRVSIPPLLLISFFENAFKYCDWDSETGNGWIRSSLKIDPENIIFTLENTISPSPKKEVFGGIGLKNTRQRLELLYPGKHHLTARTQNGIFRVEMQITTSFRNKKQPPAK